MTANENLADMVEWRLTQRTASTEESDLNPLLDLLGCQYVAEGSDGVKILIRPEPPQADEALVCSTLIDAMLSQASRPGGGAPENCMSILDGLTTNDRWRACRMSHETATALAIMLVDLFDSVPQSGAGYTLRDNIWNRVCSMLNSWFPQAMAFNPDRGEPRDMFQLARAMYGDIWCDIVLSGLEKKAWLVPAIVRANRPAFLPGLLPGLVEPIAVVLPELDGQ